MKTICITSIFTLLVCFSLSARTIRAPLSLERGPLSQLYTEIERDCWTGSFWSGYYQKAACTAFNCAGKKTPLATLFFNKPTFSVQEAFFQSTIPSSLTNPLLNTSIIGPRVEYKESGVSLGGTLQRWECPTWRWGLRAHLPVKKIRVKRRASAGNGSSDLGGQTPTDLATERIEFVNGVPVTGFAYRLDLLSRLPYTCLPCPARDIPLVNYQDGDFPLSPITISNQDITTQNLSPVTVLASSTGSVPNERFAIPQEEALQLPPLTSNGTSAGPNGRAQFSQLVSYLPLEMSEAQQAQLFIVPSVAQGRTVAPARIIRQHVNELLACIDQEAEALLKECGISFESQCSRGIGDLETELFIGHSFSDCFYAELYGGVTWPTGRKQNNPRLVFKQPLGNNGHYEGVLGGQALYQVHPWVALQLDLSWHPVHRRQECVATAFQGAGVKGIGLPTKASISWDSLLFKTDLLITPPSLCASGLDISYELYHKSHDTVCFKNGTALDCLGNRPLLDARVLTRATKATSHKIRAELFYSASFIELFGGGGRTIAGKNTPRETDWHVGLACYF